MNKRIEYIDAMRGFTMILVVVCHVAGFCLDIQNDTPSIHPFLYEFRMPTFFFISGFVLYKHGIKWDAKHTYRFLKKKFPVQIVTTTIIFLVFIHINNYTIKESLYSESKQGYWFTYTLFIYFIVYSFCRTILTLCSCKKIAKDLIILIIGFLFYLLFSVKSVYNCIPIDYEFKSLLSMHHWGYYFFFCIGTLFKKHYNYIQELIDLKPIITICLIIFFGFNLFYDELTSTHINFFNLMTALTGIILIFSFFRMKQDIFSKEKILGRSLQYIGRRTLDIYLLHYLILPVNLIAFNSPLLRHPVPLIEFVITLVISLLVIAGCLMLSSILRMSPLLAYILFGVKKTNSDKLKKTVE